MSSFQPQSLPSTQRLLKATLIAFGAAGVILVTTVLPAEYGIDPTGIGARLGLDALAETAKAAGPSAAADPVAEAPGQPLEPAEANVVSKRAGAYRRDMQSLLLAPGEGAEIKAAMKSGDGLVFHWTASGNVAVDMHGERTGAAEDEYTSYWIERSQREASGTFTAPFDGTHGWYWLNRGSEPVTVQLEVSGFQQELFRPDHE
ncbi:hypothetical protein [Azotobacter salinestris]|uniref:hypothetical protein n=1 Tax=Azotobacter salinestris TaxID=69964 RepID=UPI001266D0A0|nr:hypothetical protein [Azotobacter salinestris]